MKFTLDNVVIYVHDIPITAFDVFVERLHVMELKGTIPEVYRSIGKGHSEYHHKLNIGRGGGSISIGYKHNMEKENAQIFKMRIEFNPAKYKKELQQNFWAMFRKTFQRFRKTIKQLDLAFDVEKSIKDLVVVSNTGRNRSYFKDTLYFGSPGKNGRLKVYDKKNELEENQEIQIIQEDLTRIEYTLKFDTPLLIDYLIDYNVDIEKEYTVSLLDLDGIKPTLKACILAVKNNLMPLNEFSRDMKNNIKKALENMITLEINHTYQCNKKMIIETIKSFVDYKYIKEQTLIAQK